MTIQEAEVARLRKAFAAPASVAGKMPRCPDADQIWSAVRGELPPATLREIVEHVALCAACAEDWRIAKAFEEEAHIGEIEVEEEEEARVFPMSRFRPWAAAAAAALVLTVSGIQIHDMQQKQKAKEEESPRYRGSAPIKAAITVGAALPRNAFVLAWKPVEGAESYDLLVNNADLTFVANPKGLTTTSYQVPAVDLARLPPGTELHWKVTAIGEDGGALSTATFTNRLQ